MIELVIGLVILLWLALGVAVYSHANSRGRSGIFWFLVVLVTGIFGMMVYFLVITSEGNESTSQNRVASEDTIPKASNYDTSTGESSSVERVPEPSDYVTFGLLAVFLFILLVYVGVAFEVSLLISPVAVFLGKKAHEKWDLRDAVQIR